MLLGPPEATHRKLNGSRVVSRGRRHHVLVAKDDHPRLHSSAYPHVKMDKDDAKAAQQKETRMTQLQADVPSGPQRGVSSHWSLAAPSTAQEWDTRICRWGPHPGNEAACRQDRYPLPNLGFSAQTLEKAARTHSWEQATPLTVPVFEKVESLDAA